MTENVTVLIVTSLNFYRFLHEGVFLKNSLNKVRGNKSNIIEDVSENIAQLHVTDDQRSSSIREAI